MKASDVEALGRFTEWIKEETAILEPAIDECSGLLEQVVAAPPLVLTDGWREQAREAFRRVDDCGLRLLDAPYLPPSFRRLPRLTQRYGQAVRAVGRVDPGNVKQLAGAQARTTAAQQRGAALASELARFAQEVS